MHRILHGIVEPPILSKKSSLVAKFSRTSGDFGDGEAREKWWPHGNKNWAFPFIKCFFNGTSTFSMSLIMQL